MVPFISKFPLEIKLLGSPDRKTQTREYEICTDPDPPPEHVFKGFKKLICEYVLALQRS